MAVRGQVTRILTSDWLRRLTYKEADQDYRNEDIESDVGI